MAARSFFVDGHEVAASYQFNHEVGENFGEAEVEDYDDDENEQNGNDESENIAVPSMPDEYYHHVDEFLKRDPPKLKITDKTKKKKSLQQSDQIPIEAMKPSVLLPSIGKRDIPKSLPRQELIAPPKPKAVSKVASSIKAKNPGQSKRLDENLLLQAFAYTDKLAREALEEENEIIQSTKSRPPQPGNWEDERALTRSAPIESSGDDFAPVMKPRASSGSGSVQKSKKGSGGVVKKLRSQTQSDPSSASKGGSSGFVVATMSEDDGQKAPLDFDSLVANFQQGVTLQKLQAELQASQQSMKRSEDFMKQLAKEYLHGRR